MYIYSGEFDKCIAANLQALKIFEKLGDSSGIATSFADIGEVYNLRNQSNKALQYHRKSLAIRQAPGAIEIWNYNCPDNIYNIHPAPLQSLQGYP